MQPETNPDENSRITTTQITPVAPEISTGKINSPDTALLQTKLDGLAASSPGRVSVVVRGLEGYPTDVGASVDEDEVFRSASIIKLLVLAELLREVDAGNISLDESVGGGSIGGLAEAMITTSDNPATNRLIDRLGFANINSLATELGLTDTVLARKMLDTEAAARGEENYTSAQDVATLLEDISGDEVLSPGSRDYALSLLEAQRLDAKIPAGLPPGTRVLHKTGELDGIEHDAGIIVTPDGKSLILVVLTEGDAASNIAVISEAARISYEEMTTP